MIYLKYIGAGSYLPDVPARDLTKEEAEYHGVGRLIDSHLYEYASKGGYADPTQTYTISDTDTQYGSAKKRGKQ